MASGLWGSSKGMNRGSLVGRGLELQRDGQGEGSVRFVLQQPQRWERSLQARARTLCPSSTLMAGSALDLRATARQAALKRSGNGGTAPRSCPQRFLAKKAARLRTEIEHEQYCPRNETRPGRGGGRRGWKVLL